jgi:hypothetical protein
MSVCIMQQKRFSMLTWGGLAVSCVLATAAFADAGPDQGAAGTAEAVVEGAPGSQIQQRSADEAALVSRVETRWRALIARDFEAAYEFELPSYRERNSLEKFRGSFKSAVTWVVATVSEVRYDEPMIARVKVAVEYAAPTSWPDQAEKPRAYIGEVCFKRDGQWWHSEAG